MSYSKFIGIGTETFESLVDAVRQNNRINDAKWSDWKCSKHIQETYGKLNDSHKGTAEDFLNALIRDNGENLETYKDAMHCLEFGIR